jgi:hypothetical protein
MNFCSTRKVLWGVIALSCATATFSQTSLDSVYDGTTLQVSALIDQVGFGVVSVSDVKDQLVQRLDAYQLDVLASELQHVATCGCTGEGFARREYPASAIAVPVAFLGSALLGYVAAIKAQVRLQGRWAVSTLESALVKTPNTPQFEQDVMGVLGKNFTCAQEKIWAEEKPYWIYAGCGMVGVFAVAAIAKILDVYAQNNVRERLQAALKVVTDEQERRAAEQQASIEPDPVINEPVIEQPTQPVILPVETTEQTEPLLQQVLPEIDQQLADQLPEQLADQEDQSLSIPVVAPIAQ